jgi:cellulose synthase/poly-beta-1,6-N-acetylglucosamine synthase-like glycosyltransferase/peptidoglycan/xylan/chitin deacetylase (PgdA/CDA1 family)
LANKPVFFDATGRRAARISTVGWVAAVLSTILFIGFAASLLISQPGSNVDLPGRPSALNRPDLIKKAIAPGLLKSAARLAADARNRRLEIARLRRLRNDMPSRVLPAILKPQPGRSLAIGFYVNWGATGEASFAALKRDLKQLDWVMPSWLTLDGPNLAFKISLDRRSLNYMRVNKPGVAILPVLANATAGNWDGPGLAKLLADPARRQVLLRNIVDFVAAQKLQGVTIDFEEVPPTAHRNLEIFLEALSQAFAPHNWIIVQAAPFDDDNWPYREYSGLVDYTLLMALDEVDDNGPPGPIAGQDWYEKTLDKRMRELPADSTIISLGNYGYDWVKGEAQATTREFAEVMVAARDSGAQIAFDDDSNNPHFSYQESDGTQHDVWFLDGVTAFNQIHAADPYQPAGYALWRLGAEDPSTLDVMGKRHNAPAPASLATIPTNDDVDFDGEGEVLRVESGPITGKRTVDIDRDSGDIADETYTSLPTNYLIRRVGLQAKKIALTFDDGPDSDWTPQILDILKQKHVAATFFVIGSNMEAHPGLVQRILDEGHEIGNHTFTHPNLADTPPAAVRLELNATQRLFEALTGRSMRLLRPPYLGDAEPTDADEIVPIEEAQKLGYITVGTHIDTLDWQMLPVDKMMQLVEKEAHDPNPDLRGSIVLMHDSGGDRSQTVKLLPVLIDRLRAEGYSFVPVSQLAGFSRDQVMPPLSPTLALYADRVVFLTLSYLGQALYYCFIGAIILGVGRMLLLCGLAFANWGRKPKAEPPPSTSGQTVTVLIPAFNEEKVIVSTVERILASDYRDLEVLVIDDGSSDHTAYIVRSHFLRDARVGVISIPNGGKANALNIGLSRARGEVVVALDADTQFNSDTISRLVRWFADPEIGAVAGNAKVGNRINMITRWQALEYIVAQNLERRALSALDTLTVVPGAVGAWRREALLEMGGFPADTLAEDQDLTIAIQTRGYRALFDSTAIAWTEAPATFRGLGKQRFRWAYGTLQCLWKYRAITFNPRYGELGMIALPQVWLFQILLTTLAPVADLLLVWQLISSWLAYIQHGAEFSSGDLRTIGIYYCIFIVVDMICAMAGFVMERRENWNLLWWLLLQRFGYRQLMYYVVVRSIATAVRGPFVGWGKLERHGTVKAAMSR